jgi:putative flavoprotein involved in K+ transport
MSEHVHEVTIIGAGPAGLSSAYELTRRGIQPLVLEKTASVGDVWRNHYDGLRLNTGRRFSTLPGSPFPKSAGAWPTRDDLVNILETYPARGGFSVVTGIEVGSVDYDIDEDIWRIASRCGQFYKSRSVVLATGAARIPVIPQWEGMNGFPGEVLHSSAFQNASRYAGKHVLVVGTGNSSAEIASRLTEHARTVTLSARTSPQILPKSICGMPLAGIGAAVRYLPRPMLRPLFSILQRKFVGDLSAYGLPFPKAVVRDSSQNPVTPTLYAGFASDIRAGRIRVVGPIHKIEGRSVQVRESVEGERGSNGTIVALEPDAIIAGTGFRTGIGNLVKTPGVTRADDVPLVTGARDSKHAPRLYFIGHSNPVSGQLREIALEATRIAKKIHAKA